MKTTTSLLIAGTLLFSLTGLVPARAAVDDEAAQALLKKSDCFKCHAVDKKKDGPSYKEVAKKYMGKADAESKLVKHVTLKPIIEIDGVKEEHKAIKSSDPVEIRNAVHWILTR
jgi:cytochrome c